MDDLRDLYEEVILDHNRNPRNFNRKAENGNCEAHGFNPLCGDEFTIHMAVEEGVINDVSFTGVGCAISTASASLMTAAVKGKTVAEAEALFASVHELLTDEKGEDVTDKVGKLKVLAGVKEYPMRVKCATLAWHTMHAAMENKESTICTE
jgi:nitrogen fixation NifU-like protein